MPAEKELLLKEGQEAWLKTQFQPSMSANIYHVEDSLFWTNLPRTEGQVLMLRENQTVEVGISHTDGFYSAETKLVEIKNQYDRFYGFAIPAYFTKTQERQFMRAPHAANVMISAGDLIAHTSLINFSAGGIMVFMVPALRKVIESGKDINLSIGFKEGSISSPAVFSWEKSYDNIPFAGFRFSEINEATRQKIDDLVRKLTENK